jgi:hypothetical protein
VNILQYLARHIEGSLENLSTFKKGDVEPYATFYLEIIAAPVTGLEEAQSIIGNNLVNILRQRAFDLYTVEVSRYFTADLSSAELLAVVDAVDKVTRNLRRRHLRKLLGYDRTLRLS